MKISRRSFILGGTAAVGAAAIMPTLSGCTPKTKSGLAFADFETDGVKTLGLGLENANNSDKPTKLYTIVNNKGAELCITNFGARIVSLMVPDKNGQLKDVVLGFDNIRAYANYKEMPNNFHGAIVGRYANRIKGGTWTYNGNTYQVDKNEKGNMLHGGKFGTHFQTFDVVAYDSSKSISLRLIMNDKDMGFPGQSTLDIIYTLNDNNTVGVFYSIMCTEACPVNVSNHSYWVISGDTNHPITQDNLTIYSKATTPVDEQLIPTGEIRPTETGGVFDFFGKSGEGKLVGRDLDVKNEQLSYGKGYDHNFVLMSKDEAEKNGVNYNDGFEITDDGSRQLSDKAHLAAKATSNVSGITMTIVTTEPAVQFFDCHDMDGSIVGKKKPFGKHAAFVLEPQHFPDSPNHPNFPNTIMPAGKVYLSKTEYRFTV